MQRATTPLACLIVVVLGGCGASGGYAPTNLETAPSPPPPVAASPPPGAPAAVVAMKGLAFLPHTVTIPAGRSVEWINRDEVRHNVTTLDGATIASPDVPAGARFAFVSARPGRLRYYCTIHPSTMSGELIVRPR